MRYNMFGKRADGRVIRNLEPMQQIMPYILKTRTDSMNMFLPPGQKV